MPNHPAETSVNSAVSEDFSEFLSFALPCKSMEISEFILCEKWYSQENFEFSLILFIVNFE